MHANVSFFCPGGTTWSIIPSVMVSNVLFYLTIIPWARVGYEMVNSQLGAKRRVLLNSPRLDIAVEVY